MLTTMVDLNERRVLYVTPGKDAACIEKSVAYLEEKQVDTDKIKQVCIDMSPAFISGSNTYLPDASISFDKFHVIKEVNKAIDELRKLERNGNALLKGHKYTLLKSRLTPKLKEEAQGYLAFWCDLVEESKIQPFIKAAKTIKAHWTGIINYIESQINNGILEGINSKIQLAKKRARGYRNVRNFINMIYFICGKLKFDYPI